MQNNYTLKHHYSDNIAHKRVVIIGPMPPPLGGVSVHVQRVSAKLKKQANYVVHVESEPLYRHRLFFIYMIKVIYILLKVKPHMVHMHTLFLPNGLRELRWVMWFKRLLKFDVILIEHNCRYVQQRDKTWKDRLNKLLPSIEQQVLIGNLTAQSFAQCGIVHAQKTTVEAAFLPPLQKDEAKIVATYPQEVFTFIEQHQHVLLANASALRFFEGKDLYGFDRSIEALARLNTKESNVGVILALSKVENEEYLACLKQKIATLQMQKHVYILTGQKELWPLLKKVDVFVRPTLSDGASVSVQEALWCNLPVVASDVCNRPDNVHLFKTGNVDDLTRVLCKVLVNILCPIKNEATQLTECSQ